MDETLIDTLISFGISFSNHRYTIFEAICEKKYIDNIDSFWIELRKEHNISWATTYATFRMFTDKDILEKVHNLKDHKISAYRLKNLDNI